MKKVMCMLLHIYYKLYYTEVGVMLMYYIQALIYILTIDLTNILTTPEVHSSN